MRRTLLRISSSARPTTIVPGVRTGCANIPTAAPRLMSCGLPSSWSRRSSPKQALRGEGGTHDACPSRPSRGVANHRQHDGSPHRHCNLPVTLLVGTATCVAVLRRTAALFDRNRIARRRVSSNRGIAPRQGLAFRRAHHSDALQTAYAAEIPLHFPPSARFDFYSAVF